MFDIKPIGIEKKGYNANQCGSFFYLLSLEECFTCEAESLSEVKLDVFAIDLGQR